MSSITDNLKNYGKKFLEWGGFQACTLSLMNGDVFTTLLILVIYQFVIIIFGNHLD
ncbi:MAG TPA: hypothetical protein PKY82_02050 [Pyrinomonadaceae bacterium]|nr:hypothetical protein [Pyrinomonadaceae bacterium]